MARLGELADTALGKMLDAARPKGTAVVPYLRNVNVQWGRIDLDDVLTVPLNDEEVDRFALEQGDLLVCEGGEIGRAAQWRGQSGYMAYQKALHRVRSKGDLDLTYLRYLLEYFADTGALRSRATGSTILHLPQRQLRELPVPHPPIAEQRRIVEILEDHLSRLDAAESSLSAAQNRARRLGESMVERAVQGEWPTASIGDIASVGSGATPLRSRSDYYDGGTIPWVTSGAINDIVVREPTALITETALRETAVKMWPAGTILVAMYGEGRTRGRCSELSFPSTTNQACAAIVLHEQHDELRPWLKLVLRSRYQQMRRLASGGVQPNLSLGIIKAMELPVPPADVRSSALAQVAQADESLSNLIEQLQRAVVLGVSLRVALLAAAFSGRLSNRALAMSHE
jgi:type I restriction enzyme S subunit